MIKAFSKASLTAMAAVVLFGCTAQTKTEKSETTLQTSQDAPPTFADALETHAPLSKVNGDHLPLPGPNVPTPSLFSNVIEAAEANGTYALLVWHDGSLVLEQYFSGYDRDLRPQSASMHKSVLSLVVLAAIEDGFIDSVDQGVEAFIPEWRDDPRSDITIRHLLSMASGLRPLSTEGGGDAPAIKFVTDGSGARSTILSMELEHRPGEVFHYQNAVNQLLCLILERATGQGYADYLSERLWAPIGADDAFVWLNEADGFPRTYTALFARAEDWLRIGLLIKDYGSFSNVQIIERSLIEQATAPSQSNENYGWQVWLGTQFEALRHYNAAQEGYAVKASAPFAADDIIYLDGFGGQRVYISRSLDLVIVRLGDADLEFDDAFLPNAIITALE